MDRTNFSWSNFKLQLVQHGSPTTAPAVFKHADLFPNCCTHFGNYELVRQKAEILEVRNLQKSRAARFLTTEISAPIRKHECTIFLNIKFDFRTQKGDGLFSKMIFHLVHEIKRLFTFKRNFQRKVQFCLFEFFFSLYEQFIIKTQTSRDEKALGKNLQS